MKCAHDRARCIGSVEPITAEELAGQPGASEDVQIRIELWECATCRALSARLLVRQEVRPTTWLARPAPHERIADAVERIADRLDAWDRNNALDVFAVVEGIDS